MATSTPALKLLSTMTISVPSTPLVTWTDAELARLMWWHVDVVRKHLQALATDGLVALECGEFEWRAGATDEGLKLAQLPSSLAGVSSTARDG